MATNNEHSKKIERRVHAMVPRSNAVCAHAVYLTAEPTLLVLCPWCRGQGQQRTAQHCGICRSRGLVEIRSYTQTEVSI